MACSAWCGQVVFASSTPRTQVVLLSIYTRNTADPGENQHWENISASPVALELLQVGVTLTFPVLFFVCVLSGLTPEVLSDHRHILYRGLIGSTSQERKWKNHIWELILHSRDVSSCYWIMALPIYHKYLQLHFPYNYLRTLRSGLEGVQHIEGNPSPSSGELY